MTRFLPVLEWKEEDIKDRETKKVRYGYFKNMPGIIHSTEEQKRAVDQVVEALRAAGEDVVEIEVP